MRDQEIRKEHLAIALQMSQSVLLELLIAERLKEETERRERLTACDPESEVAQHAASLVDFLQDLLEEAESLADESRRILLHFFSPDPAAACPAEEEKPSGT